MVCPMSGRRRPGRVGLQTHPYFFQDLYHLLWGSVQPAGNQPPLSIQKSYRGKASLIIPTGDIWALVYVYPDWDELGVDQLDDLGMRVGGLIHHVAPVAPGSSEGQQNGLTLLLSRTKSLLIPFPPVDAWSGLGRPMTLLCCW